MAQKTKVDTLYTVAYQPKEGQPVDVYRIREANRMELFAFIKRVLNITTLTDASFIEVHEQLPEGKGARVVYGNPAISWPKGVPTRNHDSIMARKPPTTDNITIIPEQKPASTDTGLVVKELRDKAVALFLPLKIKVA